VLLSALPPLLVGSEFAGTEDRGQLVLEGEPAGVFSRKHELEALGLGLLGLGQFFCTLSGP
jgi:hypothetical protein